jgi:nucleobase:cation symporter-1, NCS1 family
MQVGTIRPVALAERNLTFVDLAFIWFGAAISITEIWAGGLPQLTGLGLGLGFLAILAGRVVGNGLMGLMAHTGGVTGLPSMVLARAAFGQRGSAIPALFNVLQLIGWTGWMLFVGFTYLDTLAGMFGWPVAAEQPSMRIVWVLILGALCILWAAGGEKLWQRVQIVSAVLLFLLTILMSWVVLTQYDVHSIWLPRGCAGAGGFLQGMDLVIAMSVSWLPLVADYSRYTKRGTGGRATFWGYFVGGVWMYATGLLVALAAHTDAPDVMVVHVMGRQGLGWAVIAVALVLLSTVTTTFLDIFSTVVSAQNLWPRLPRLWGNVIAGGLGILLALVLDVFAYAPFLEAIGLIFLPAFTIVLADYFLVRRRSLDLDALTAQHSAYWYRAGFNWRALVAWAAGIVVYDWAGGFHSLGYFAGLAGGELSTPGWPTGSSLPCIAITVAVYLALAKLRGRREVG